jgi:hypothetical protein
MTDQEREPDEKDDDEVPAPVILRPKGSRTSPVPLEYVVPWRGDQETR